MKLLCKIGLHRWVQKDGDYKRTCKCCGKAQQMDEEAYLEWGVSIWLDE